MSDQAAPESLYREIMSLCDRMDEHRDRSIRYAKKTWSNSAYKNFKTLMFQNLDTLTNDVKYSLVALNEMQDGIDAPAAKEVMVRLNEVADALIRMRTQLSEATMADAVSLSSMKELGNALYKWLELLPSALRFLAGDNPNELSQNLSDGIAAGVLLQFANKMSDYYDEVNARKKQ
jgi:hypothetical protein